MKYLAVLLLAALACASPVEKREADADPSVSIYGHPGYGYSHPIFYRGYGYQSPYGRSYRHDLHKRAADAKADADPSYIPLAHALYRPSSVGPNYAHPYRPVHPVHKRSADPEPEPSYHFPIYSPYPSYHPTTYGYPQHPVHKRSADPEPSYLPTVHSPYHSYQPTAYSHSHRPVHKRSADPKPEPSYLSTVHSLYRPYHPIAYGHRYAH